jgi:hypothetical protein
MASLEVGPLSSFLEDEEIRAVVSALEEHGAPSLDEPRDDDVQLVERSIDEDVLADFMDQLEANDAGADLYLPVDFDDVLDASGNAIGSAHALLLALGSMREDIGIDEDDDDDNDDYVDDDDDDDDEDLDDSSRGLVDDELDAIELKEQLLRHLWRAFHRGAQLAI